MKRALILCSVISSVIGFAWEARADLEAMKARVPKIVELKDSGCIGERPDGLLGVTDKQCAGAKETVDAENEDRREVYKERAKEHDLTTFQQIMGEARMKKEPAGRKVLDASGKWKTKE
jgi:uncharacterized protein YdbL (DUF1318 family)